MDHYLMWLREELPGNLHSVLSWDFIPWSFVEDRHRNLPCAPLIALFDAYLLLDSHLDLEAMVSLEIPPQSWGCERCGYCCASMRPGPVKPSAYRAWEAAGAPVAWFYSPQGRRNKNSVYRCWYHNGVRLMICPFMFINRKDHRPFCAIYPMGNEFRPSVCSKYIPRHEACTSRPTEIEPWEIN
jgi:hypothetical protein